MEADTPAVSQSLPNLRKLLPYLKSRKLLKGFRSNILTTTGSSVQTFSMLANAVFVLMPVTNQDLLLGISRLAM
jgi:hypothetical protein